MKDWGFDAGCLASKRRRVKGVQGIWREADGGLREEKASNESFGSN